MLTQAATEAQKAGKLPNVALPEATIERPQKPEHGDYASGFPMKLARATKANPMKIAQDLVSFIASNPTLEKVVVAPPGFINFTFSKQWLTGQVDSILTEKANFGNVDSGKNNKVQLEFVSANPVGPLHVGSGRGAVLGSTLANVLAASGWQVQTEYYFNDQGSRMEAYYKSLYARYLQALGKEAQMPEDGYMGAYMQDFAKEVIAAYGDKFAGMPEADALREIGNVGLDKVIGYVKTDLKNLGVSYDNWFTERSLYENGQYDKIMALLREKGYVAEREGAVWFVSTALGEDKDNVLVRSDGSPGYFATDIAYHYNKFFERKFDSVIDIWGADHQGHVPRLKAAVTALGVEPKRLEIIIHQLVTLRRGNEIVKISKRSGDMVTMRELLDEVGSDAVRFFFLGRSANGQMDFDIELAKKESADNPVYYVQYAHARIASILRLAEEKGIDYSKGEVSLLVTEPELTLIRKLLILPELVDMVSRTLEPHHLPYYAQDLANAFHSFYKQCRVVSEEEAITEARLKLVSATQIVLAKTLHLMGVSAPEKM